MSCKKVYSKEVWHFTERPQICFACNWKVLCTSTSSWAECWSKSQASRHHEFFCLLAPVPPTPTKRGNQIDVACFSSDFLQQHMSTSLRDSARLCVWSIRTLRHPPDNPLVYPIPLNIRLMLHFKLVRYRSVLCGTGRCVYMPVLWSVGS